MWVPGVCQGVHRVVVLWRTRMFACVCKPVKVLLSQKTIAHWVIESVFCRERERESERVRERESVVQEPKNECRAESCGR